VRVGWAEDDGEVELVEHLFAALGGLGIQHGVAVAVTGPEIPLLDGGARAFCDAIALLELTRSPSPLRVTRSTRYEIEGARYELDPGPATCIDVDVEFGQRGVEHARWDGTPDQFANEIAPARTFGFASELGDLRARGRAVHVDADSVIALDDDGRGMPPHRPPDDGELARHKLLDLVGDLYLYGGPPRGRISAVRPGHRANHAMVARALADGALDSL
jgi:UDP-3-O-[3-hydroxymyristoyl] N-acetylglucosamine deacetylase